MHRAIADFLHLVDTGVVTRGIINAPPRFGKTEEICQFWPAWHYLRNSRCRFVEISYSEPLICESSTAIRNIMNLEEIRYLFDAEFKTDTNRKDLWKLDGGGTLRVASSGGQITGFGFGLFGADEFSGAMIISDPVKPDDALSLLMQERFNNRYNNTFRSRGNDPRSPILIEMQRLSPNDLSEFLLRGGSGERWHHLVLSAVSDDVIYEDLQRRYRDDWTHAIPLDWRQPDGFLWKEKYNETQDLALLASPDVRSSQYLQNPKVSDFQFFYPIWFPRYDDIDVDTGVQGYVWFGGRRILLKELVVFADTAHETGKQNDYSVLELFGRGADGKGYLIDVLRGKWEAPDLVEVSKKWLERYEAKLPRKYGWRTVRIEKKASGHGLIQTLRRKWGASIMPIERVKDKIARAYGVQNDIKEGIIRLPKNAHWLSDYLKEFAEFNKNETHAHDDQIDPTMDAVEWLKSGGHFDWVGLS